MRKNVCGVADREQCSNSTAFPPFARDFYRELDNWLTDLRRTTAQLGRNLFEPILDFRTP